MQVAWTVPLTTRNRRTCTTSSRRWSATTVATARSDVVHNTFNRRYIVQLMPNFQKMYFRSDNAKLFIVLMLFVLARKRFFTGWRRSDARRCQRAAATRRPPTPSATPPPGASTARSGRCRYRNTASSVSFQSQRAYWRHISRGCSCFLCLSVLPPPLQYFWRIFCNFIVHVMQKCLPHSRRLGLRLCIDVGTNTPCCSGSYSISLMIYP